MKSKAISKEKDKSSFKSFLAVTLLQIKDKMKFSIHKSDGSLDKKTIIQKSVFFGLRFVIVAALVAVLFFIINAFSIITKTEFVNLYIVFFFIFMVMNLLSNTYGLMKDLYYADDNRFLVTMPVNSSGLFFSKLTVYIIQDFFKSFEIIIPVTVGFGIITSSIGQITIGSLFFSLIVIIFTNVAFVILAAFLSIPLLYIYKFLKSYPISEMILLLTITVLGIILVIYLISLIPENIDLFNEWPSIKNDIQNNVNNFNNYIYPFKFIVITMFGNRTAASTYRLDGTCFLNFLIIIGILLALVGLAYIIIKPFYFNMMTKTFEFDKTTFGASKKNKKLKKFITFTNKEFKLSFRDIEISGSYLIVYIVTPLMLYFLDKVFAAIDTRLEGDILTYSVNILLIVLPYLASNSLVATMYSKEGRTAYLKKTKPINVFLPLTSKLFFNLSLSIPSIIGCAIVFGNFANIGIFPPIAVAISVLLIQYGHIFFSATKDLMNPQNEEYATNGEQISNPNERISTIVGFIVSFALAFISWFFLTEANNLYNDFTAAFVRIIIVSVLFFGACILLYILYVKAYYYEK